MEKFEKVGKKKKYTKKSVSCVGNVENVLDGLMTHLHQRDHNCICRYFVVPFCGEKDWRG